MLVCLLPGYLSTRVALHQGGRLTATPLPGPSLSDQRQVNVQGCQLTVAWDWTGVTTSVSHLVDFVNRCSRIPEMSSMSSTRVSVPIPSSSQSTPSQLGFVGGMSVC